MENLHGMTVKNLQAKRREMDVSCSGNKKQLIERLEDIGEMRNLPTMTERVKQLEKTLAEMRATSMRFQPSQASSPMQTFASIEGSPVRSTNVAISHGNSPLLLRQATRLAVSI